MNGQSTLFWGCTCGENKILFIGRTDAEAEASIFWLSDVKSQLIRKDSGAGKNRGQEEKGVAEGEMFR